MSSSSHGVHKRFGLKERQNSPQNNFEVFEQFSLFGDFLVASENFVSFREM